jgi:hypothetical protein
MTTPYDKSWTEQALDNDMTSLGEDKYWAGQIQDSTFL